MSVRPTTDPKLVVLDLFDDGWRTLDTRLGGLTDDEYLWEPVSEVWTVRPTSDGSLGIADGADHLGVDTGPVTTIAWRMWHLAADCFDNYSARIAGRVGPSETSPAWSLDAATAHHELAAAADRFRELVAARTTGEWWEMLGDNWGPFRHHSLFDLVQHASHELVHHGAEIALLRDLYAAQ